MHARTHSGTSWARMLPQQRTFVLNRKLDTPEKLRMCVATGRRPFSEFGYGISRRHRCQCPQTWLVAGLFTRTAQNCSSQETDAEGVLPNPADFSRFTDQNAPCVSPRTDDNLQTPILKTFSSPFDAEVLLRFFFFLKQGPRTVMMQVQTVG